MKALSYFKKEMLEVDGFDLSSTFSGRSFRGEEGDGAFLGDPPSSTARKVRFPLTGSEGRGRRACEGALAPLHRPRNHIRHAAQSGRSPSPWRGCARSPLPLGTPELASPAPKAPCPGQAEFTDARRVPTAESWRRAVLCAPGMVP